MSKEDRASGKIVRLLERLGELGNRLPDPVTLFIIFTGLVVLASFLFEGASAEVIQRSGETKEQVVQSLLSAEGIRWMFLNAVENFVGFAPLGPVLTVMIGIGIAEQSGFISTGLTVLVKSVPKSLVTAALVFGGVMSSMAADAGYVVLTPLGALLFAGMGRHPLAGLAAAYAGVSGGFSANLLITGLDPMLAKLTEQAAQSIDAAYSVNATSNWYFMVFSTVLITVMGTFVNWKFVEPMLGKWTPAKDSGLDLGHEVTGEEKKAFMKAMAAGGVVLLAMLLLALIPGSPLRDEIKPGDPAVNALSSFFHSIEILITALFVAPALVFGILIGRIKNDKDVAKMGAAAMSSMGAYLVLAFVAGQFVAFFNWTSLGAITAVKGADILQAIGLTGVPLLLGFIIVAAFMNLLVGSASAKWAFMAPIFVPMMMMMGFSPELTQVAYRVGDSVTNIITPLMPYLPIIIVFAQRYDKEAGMGTIIAAMIPYSVVFGIVWTIVLLLWFVGGVPLGPAAPVFYSPPGG